MSKDDSQKTTVVEGIAEGVAPDTTDTGLRYAAYGARLRTIVMAAHRYVAYTSDIGESFRPIVPPQLVTAAYGISWLYLAGDVAYESWRARLRQQGLYKPGLVPWHEVPQLSQEEKEQIAENAPDWRVAGVQRAVFQSIASMGLPAFTIHQSVHWTGKALKNVKNPLLKTWGPVGVGLAIVPALPYMFDEPVEKAVDYVFEKGEEMFAHAKKE